MKYLILILVTLILSSCASDTIEGTYSGYLCGEYKELNIIKISQNELLVNGDTAYYHIENNWFSTQGGMKGYQGYIYTNEIEVEWYTDDVCYGVLNKD